MVTLSSLLVQRGVASMRAVEEAIARQVLHGGDLATAVLEGGVVAEAVLTPLFAESLGLSPAIGRLRPASPEALRLLPSDLAAQHRVFPLELRRGDSGTGGAPDTLVIATSEPLPAAVEEDLAFALAAAIQQVAAPPAEPAQDDEPGPLSARTRAALLQGLRGRGDVSAFTGAAPQPLDDAWGLRSDEPGSAPRPFVDTWGLRSDEPSSATPPPPRDESQIDTVARAFGLRGTGVEDLAPVSLKSIAGAIRHSADHAGPTPVPPVPHLPHSAASTEFAMAPTIEMPSPRTPSPPALEPPALEPPALEPEPDDEPEAGVHPGSVPERIALSPAGPRRLDRAEPGGRATPGSGFAGLVQAVIEGGEDAPRAISELYRNGEAAMKAIAARFPGPLWIERRARELCAGPGGQEALGRLPPASECGPVLELIVAFRRLALPFMTVRAASPDPETRFWATHVLGELRYPEAANALLPRLFDDDAAVRRVARRAAAALVHEGAPPGKPGSSWAPPALDGSRRSGPHPSPGTPLVQGLEYILRSPDEPLPRKLMAIETAAAIRARALVPALTALLHDPHEFLVDAATRALEAIPDEGAG